MTHQAFSWRGEPIYDIGAWAKGQGERMVRYRAERWVPSPWDGGLIKEEYEGEMPETFWGTLCIQHGWKYTELRGAAKEIA